MADIIEFTNMMQLMIRFSYNNNQLNAYYKPNLGNFSGTSSNTARSLANNIAKHFYDSGKAYYMLPIYEKNFPDSDKTKVIDELVHIGFEFYYGILKQNRERIRGYLTLTGQIGG